MSATHFSGPLIIGGKQTTGNTAVASVAVTDAVASVGVPTKGEFDAVVALANSNKAQINALLAQLRNAGIILT